jgi:guanidinobutyrase
LTPLAAEIKAKIGDKRPMLLMISEQFGPGLCASTGTPEIGGLTTLQAMGYPGGLRGLSQYRRL